MKLKEKLANDFILTCPPELDLRGIYLAGMEKMREMAGQAIIKAKESYTGHDSYILQGYIGCSQFAMAEIKKLGEEEVKDESR